MDPTYKVPTKNIIATPIFFTQCNLSLGTWLSGITSIHKSTATLKLAFAHPKAPISIQEPLRVLEYLVQ